tara:strand:+ start:609 stop:4208 length:3600 start_codon:yes stop_codon:yes gene_type:complete
MVFDNFTLGVNLHSNHNDIRESYVYNSNLYVITTDNSNLIIYNIDQNLDSSNILEIVSNIPLNSKEYFFINGILDSNIILYTTNLTDKLTIDTNTYTYSNTTITNNYSNVNAGFYYNNDTYVIDNTGKSIYKIDDAYHEYKINANITDFSESQDNNVIHCIVDDIVDHIIYVIVSDQNCILKCNINDAFQNQIIILINDYHIVKKKFSKAIYSKITNKIYLIPYNIVELLVIDVDTNTIEFIPLDDLTHLKTRAFFSTAVEHQGYIYMIPEALNFIYVFSIYENKIINIMDISSYNSTLNESLKFIDAYIFKDSLRKRIFAVPNKSNKLGLIDYDIREGDVLEAIANFNILTHKLFNKNNLDGVYSLDNALELGTNTFYNTTYTRGTTDFTLYSLDSSNIFEWRPKNAITMKDKGEDENHFSCNIKTIDDIQYFQDDNNKNIFEIYASRSFLYKKFQAKDFLNNDLLCNISINNIYSIENNTIYFIPYNFNSLITLELNNEPPILKLLDIAQNIDTNANKFRNFIDTEKGNFNCSIIVNDNLYMVPYIDNENENENDIIPLVIYDFNDTKTNVFNIIIKDLKTILNTSDTNKLFCTVLFYEFNSYQYLFLISENGNCSIFYNITNDTFNKITITDNDNNYSDGYIDITRRKSYLLDDVQSNIYIYDIQAQDDTSVNFSYNKTIALSNIGIDKQYSKMLYNSNVLYLIPYNAYKIGKISDLHDENPTFSEIVITNSEYTSNEQLFKGGTLLTLNESTYIIMVPYHANKLYLYNITEESFTYIEDAIFNTNKFVDCTVDIKGNIYFNTSEGNILYYVLSIEKFYIKPRLPVLLNKTQISFKDIYKKFHKDFIYDKYNYNNKQIKFSDYFNEGGTTYYTESRVKENKFIINAAEIISTANCNNTQTTLYTYNDFIELQCNFQLNIKNYKKARSQRYEYYDVYEGTREYKIDSVNIAPDNTYIYYVKTYKNKNHIALYGANTLIDENRIDNIGNFTIDNISTTVFSNLNINLGATTIINKMDNNDDIKDYTIIEAFVKKAIIVNYNVDFDTKYFIKYGANKSSTPKETMAQLTTIEFNIEGELAKGLRINIDGISDSSYTDDDKYLSSLNIINIIINEDGIINYMDDTKSSIILINPFLLLDLHVNIYENITKTESYAPYDPYDPYENITKTDLKINKLTLEITDNINTDINIDRYSTLISFK